MNHSYCLLWNDATQRYVPAPETARRRSKSRTALALGPMALLLGALLAPCAQAQALPTGGKVVSGQATIDRAGKQMTIEQASGKAILHWQGFDIGHGASVQFKQPGANAIALNRVVGGKASQIDGQLRANGQVWLVNPNGVVFGQGSQVNVGGLVASTLSITDEDFEAGRQVFTRGTAQGGITNQGNITVADGGMLALLAPAVKNEGILNARLGDAVLAGGEKLTLQAGANGRLRVAVDPATVRTLIENRKLIMADGGQVLMTASAADALSGSVVSNTGEVRAHTLAEDAGRILLLGGMQHGKVVQGGVLDARAPAGGMGGFVQTSAAKVTLPAGHQVTTRATDGQTGLWLIEARDYSIAASGGDISGAQLSAGLAANNVIISTAQRGGGNIDVKDAVAWRANQLTLDAGHDVNVDARVAVDGNGRLYVNYGGTQGSPGNRPVAGSNLNVVSGSVDFEKAGAHLLEINGHGYEVINSVEGLQGIGASDKLRGRYALGGSIDAGNVDFQPIGTLEKAFTGSFDGLGHTIANLTIDRPKQDGVGLFGYTHNATLRNVGLAGGNVRGRESVGGLVGHQLAHRGNASISNAYASLNVSGVGFVGGLVGENIARDGGTASISRADSTGLVSGVDSVGGLVGANQSLEQGSKAGVDTASSAAGVVGAAEDIGGLVGLNVASSKGLSSISNVRASGPVLGGSMVGGLVGSNSAVDGTASIGAAHAAGQVLGRESSGGLVGSNHAMTGGTALVSNGQATGSVTAQSAVGGLAGSNKAADGKASIADSSASGSVSGDSEVGKLVGFNDHQALITASEATGDAMGHGLVGQDLNSMQRASRLILPLISAMKRQP